MILFNYEYDSSFTYRLCKSILSNLQTFGVVIAFVGFIPLSSERILKLCQSFQNFWGLSYDPEYGQFGYVFQECFKQHMF